VPHSKAASLETDHEALLEAQGLAARPGPRQVIDRKIASASRHRQLTTAVAHQTELRQFMKL
jgi:hypothetical protein